MNLVRKSAESAGLDQRQQSTSLNTSPGAPPCVLLSPAWPDGLSGSGSAVRSTLDAILCHTRHVECVVTSDFQGGVEAANAYERVGFHWLPTSWMPRTARALLGSVSRRPASVLRFDYSKLAARLKLVARDLAVLAGGRKPLLIVEDVPLGKVMLSRAFLRDDFYACVIHSHNVLAEIFEGMVADVPSPLHVILKLEGRNSRDIEKRILTSADAIWTITARDYNQYYSLYNIRPQGVLGVSLDYAQYNNVLAGEASTFISLGNWNPKKTHGMRNLLTNGWPIIREVVPEAKFLIGGRGSEQFHMPEIGVEAHGFVEDEREFLSRGRFFINPQESGSGLKLKSLVAMAAEKVLLSTTVGVQGIPVQSGVHCIVANGAEELGHASCAYFNRREMLSEMAAAGKALVRDAYSKESLGQVFGQLLTGLRRSHDGRGI